MKMTIQEVIVDLRQEFLARIMGKPIWKREEIVNEYHDALYALTLIYLSRD